MAEYSEALNAAWMRKNLHVRSPIELGERIDRALNLSKRMVKLFLLIAGGCVLLIITDSWWKPGSDTSHWIFWAALPVCVQALITAFVVWRSERLPHSVWNEFKGHHDFLLGRLGIENRQLPLDSITSAANEALRVEKAEILDAIETERSHAAKGNVPAQSHINAIQYQVFLYWRLHEACEYFGLSTETH